MAESSLANVLQTMVYPTTIRIASGSLTADEGKRFRQSNILTLYGRGLHVYVPPSLNAELRIRCKNEDITERTRRRSSDTQDDEYVNAENLFTKTIFISEQTSLQDSQFTGKVYRNVADLLTDLPLSVKANKSFFACADESNPNEIRRITEGEVITIDRCTDRAHQNILRGKVNGKGISIQLSNSSIDVTALPNPAADFKMRSAADVMSMEFTHPTEMAFQDEDIQQTYQIEVGFNVIPLEKRPMLSVCCSEHNDVGGIQKLDNDMLKIENIWCFNFSEEALKKVTAEVLKTHSESFFELAFGKIVGTDDNGFSLYNLYGKENTSEYLEPKLRHKQSKKVNHDIKLPTPFPTSIKAPRVPSRIRKSKTLDSLPLAPPPPIPKKAPTPPPRTQHEQPSSPYKETEFQLKSPTFSQIKFNEQDTCSDNAQEKLDQSKLVRSDEPNADVPSAIAVSDLSGANSTDEIKIEKEKGMSSPADTDLAGETPYCKQQREEQDVVNIKLLSISDIASLFRSYKLERMATVCEKELVDGVILFHLEQQDLKEEPFCLSGLALTKTWLLIKGHRPK
ncbi:uncharacterized protein LOC132543093 [Ylistrum balloti]|uniref:uncharacterized protein LOC132543093 n=1 Tax=Ylistrum balloti TaxID=509963 RepID=UPI002905CCD1|nr:uncharacterized protein LOC132543093 [Ylistrum balloti]